jgi:hypothetical protein
LGIPESGWMEWCDQEQRQRCRLCCSFSFGWRKEVAWNTSSPSSPSFGSWSESSRVESTSSSGHQALGCCGLWQGRRGQVHGLRYPLLPPFLSLRTETDSSSHHGAFISVNLALSLSRLGLNVGLLDADIYGPSIPRMMNLTGRQPAAEGKILLPLQNFGIRCMSMGFLVEEDSPIIWRGLMVMSALEQLTRQVGRGFLFLILLPKRSCSCSFSMEQTTNGRHRRSEALEIPR